MPDAIVLKELSNRDAVSVDLRTFRYFRPCWEVQFQQQHILGSINDWCHANSSGPFETGHGYAAFLDHTDALMCFLRFR